MREYWQRFLWMIWPVAVLAGLWFGVGATDARAERVYIDISQPTFDKLPVAIPDFKHRTDEQTGLSREMADLIADDLEYSGIFRPLDRRGFLGDAQSLGVTRGEIDFSHWRRLGSEFLIRGATEVQGTSIKLEMRLFDVLSARLVLGKVYEGRSKDWRSMVHRFADEVLLVLTGERGVFESKIAFVQIQGKIKEIYLVDFDGSNPIQVTYDQSISLSPAWNSDGTRLAYMSYKEGSPKVFSVNLLDGSQQLLAGFKGLNMCPAWRPGNDQVAVTLSKDGNPDIYLLSTSGDIIQRMADSWAIDVSPSWAPDGARLAYVSSVTGSPQVYVLDVAGGGKRRITFEGKYNTSPSWSPKGDWIAFSSLAQGRHNIMVVRPDGNDLQQLTHGEGDNESPSWSPDGRMLAFSSTRSGGAAIWTMLQNGTGVRRITNFRGEQRLPEWSPRFKWR